MEIRKEVVNNQVVFFIKGQIDTNTCGDLERAILEQDLGVDIVCDFKDVTYISSAGLRVILEVHKSQTSKGKLLILRNVSKDIKEIFDLTGFSSFVNIQ